MYTPQRSLGPIRRKLITHRAVYAKRLATYCAWLLNPWESTHYPRHSSLVLSPLPSPRARYTRGYAASIIIIRRCTYVHSNGLRKTRGERETAITRSLLAKGTTLTRGKEQITFWASGNSTKRAIFFGTALINFVVVTGSWVSFLFRPIKCPLPRNFRASR